MKEKEFVLVLIDAQIDLPVLVCDSVKEIMRFLNCKRTTVWTLMNSGAERRGLRAFYKVERVRIPSDEEIEKWILTNDLESSIIRAMNPSGVATSPNYTKFAFCIIL